MSTVLTAHNLNPPKRCGAYATTISPARYQDTRTLLVTMHDCF